MNRIFGEAGQVLVWLGAEADQSEKVMSLLEVLQLGGDALAAPSEDPEPLLLALELLETKYGITPRNMKAFVLLLTHSNRIHSKVDTFEAQCADIRELISKEPLGSDLFDREDPIWEASMRFAGRSWFSRVWTFQEIVLSKSAELFCGSRHVRWEYFQHTHRDLARFLTQGLLCSTDLLTKCFGSMRSFLMAIQNCDMVLQTRIADWSSDQQFVDLLSRMLSRNAKDPRDQVYGFLGLLDDDMRAAIPVDYNLSHKAVFQKAFKFACNLESGNNFWPLHMEDSERISPIRIQDSPSWCPDISTFVTKAFDAPDLGFTQRVSRRSAIAFRVQGFSRIDGDVLRIHGLQIDRVHACINIAPTLAQGFEWREPSSTFHPEVIESAIDVVRDRRYISWVNQVHELFFTGHGASFEAYKPFLQEWNKTNESDEQLLEKFKLAWSVVNFIEDLRRKMRKGKPPVLGAVNAEGFSALLWMSGIIAMNRRRYFFLTKSGFAGYCYRQVSAGDAVCYFPGGTLLHILDAKGASWLATAEVYGMMNDFILQMHEEMVKAGAWTWRTFTLV